MSNDAKNDAGYGCMGQRAVTRRGFITAACGAGAGAAAIGMLSGCASNGPVSGGENRDDAARKEFEAAADPIDPVEPPDSWDYEYGVVVVGSGGGGITGSVRLVDEGLKVALLEKNDKTGGQRRTEECSSTRVVIGRRTKPSGRFRAILTIRAKLLLGSMTSSK